MWASLRKREFGKHPLHSNVLSVQVNRDHKYEPEMAELQTELKGAHPEGCKVGFLQDKCLWGGAHSEH